MVAQRGLALMETSKAPGREVEWCRGGAKCREGRRIASPEKFQPSVDPACLTYVVPPSLVSNDSARLAELHSQRWHISVISLHDAHHRHVGHVNARQGNCSSNQVSKPKGENSYGNTYSN